jgi:glycosyltransferase involved in cell wall biosynthesis
MSLKTISILTDGIYPFVMGGMQKHSFYLAKYFALKRITVDLYHYLPEGKHISENGFTAEESKYINHIAVAMPISDKFVGRYIRQCKAYSKNILAELESRSKTDFIYAQGFTGWALLDNKNAKKKLSPIAVNFHGLEPLQQVADFKSKLQKWLLLPYLKHNLNKADYVFSLGGNLTKLLIDAGINSTKILEIPIGIEANWLVNEIPQSNKPLRFLFIGRNERRKGIHELSIAINAISNLNAEFHFIGPVSITDLSALENKERSNLHFHGAIYDQDKIKEITRSCDVLICPSFSEGMPTVILEAMSSGLTAIATNVGATNEVVNNTNGWLIDSPQPSLIIEAINEAILSSDEALHNKRANALQHIKNHFRWEMVIEKTILSIQQVQSQQ